MSWRPTELNLSIYLMMGTVIRKKMAKEWQGNANFTRLLITDLNSHLKTESFSEFLRFLIKARQ